MRISDFKPLESDLVDGIEYSNELDDPQFPFEVSVIADLKTPTQLERDHRITRISANNLRELDQNREILIRHLVQTLHGIDAFPRVPHFTLKWVRLMNSLFFWQKKPENEESSLALLVKQIKPGYDTPTVMRVKTYTAQDHPEMLSCMANVFPAISKMSARIQDEMKARSIENGQPFLEDYLPKPQNTFGLLTKLTAGRTTGDRLNRITGSKAKRKID